MLLLLRRPTVVSDPLPEGAIPIVIGNRAGATATLYVGRATIEQSGAAFTVVVDNVSDQTLLPGEARVIGVTFTPAGGQESAILRIPSSDPDGVLEVLLRGNGLLPEAVVPGISVDPASWAAGDVATTGGTALLTVTVSSTGTGPLAVGTISKTGSDFAKGGDLASGQTIPAGQSRTVQVTFDPSSNGAKSGTLTIPSDAGADVVVPLSGTGVADAPPPGPDTVEVSRFYLGRQDSPIVLPSGYASGWWRATTDTPRAMTVAKGGPPTANAPAVDARRGEVSLHGTWVSPALAAQAIETTFTCMLPAAWRSSALGAYVTSALRFLLWRAATNTLSYGSVLVQALPTEPWPGSVDAALPRRFPAGDPRSWTLSLTPDHGDRLVVQVGDKVIAPSYEVATAPTRIRYGGSAAQADAPGSIYAAAPDSAGWIEFTDPLVVLS